MKRLKIIHIIYAKEWGGGETCAYSMCRKATESGHEIFTVIDENAVHLKERFKAVSRVIELNLRQRSIIASARKLHGILKELDVDIVHTHTGRVIPLAVFAKMFTTSKLVVFRHNVIPNKSDPFHQFLYSKIDAFVCVSRLVYKVQTESIPPQFRDKFFVVHNGINTNIAVPETSRGTRLRIGFAGRIDASKGLSVLIDAVNLLRDYDIELLVAGNTDVDYFKTLSRRVAECGLDDKVTWLGFQHDMSKFYQHIDVFVMPSIVAEAFGMVLCEAMLFAKPVIATDSGAQSEIVDDSINGYIVPTGDVAAVADRIKIFVNKPELIENFGAAGRAKILRDFAMDAWLSKILAVYRTLK